MKIELGKSYITVDGRKMDPAKNQRIENGLIDLKETADKGFVWTYEVDTGKLYVRRKDAGDVYHIVSEWVEDVAPEPIAKEVKHIDQVNYLGHRKGIEKMWDSYRI